MPEPTEHPADPVVDPVVDPAADSAADPATDPVTEVPPRARPADPSELSRWRPLRLLQASMDEEIGRVYAEAPVEGLRPSFVLELLRLHARGPMTITELAESVQHTHSALSQKVAAMRRAGWVETAPGEDARSKKVTLTAKARAVVGRLAAEWEATEAALAELEAELPYPLSQVVEDIERALARRSFHDRIVGKLAEDPRWR